MNLHQCGAVLAKSGGDGLHVGGEGDALELRTTGKRIPGVLCEPCEDASGDDDIPHTAARKCLVPVKIQILREIDLMKGRAVFKRAVAKGGQALRQLYGRKAVTAEKGIGADARHAFFHHSTADILAVAVPGSGALVVALHPTAAGDGQCLGIRVQRPADALTAITGEGLRPGKGAQAQRGQQGEKQQA